MLVGGELVELDAGDADVVVAASVDAAVVSAVVGRRSSIGAATAPGTGTDELRSLRPSLHAASTDAAATKTATRRTVWLRRICMRERYPPMSGTNRQHAGSFEIGDRPSHDGYGGTMTDEARPYGGGTSDPALKRVRTRHFQRAKEQGIKITGLTSYDFLSASIFDEAGIDFLLVGDSAGNTVFGYDTTIPVTLDELIPLTAAVVRGASRALVVADMPFGSYENGPDEALATAIRFMKETGCHAVKLEGGVRSAKQIKRVVRAGIPVMAHIGFTPQSEHGLGGHIIQGRGEDADKLLDDAHAVADAGAFAVVLEMVPSAIAGRVTEELSVPTISVGAGPHCDGQLLVWSDWAGMSRGRIPRFVKQYAQIGDTLLEAAKSFREEVESGVYPAAEHEYSE